MKKAYLVGVLLSLFSVSNVVAQTALANAKKYYNKGEYAQALPLFEAEYAAKSADASINHWYGVCLYNTGSKDYEKIEKLLLVGSKRRIKDSFLYLGLLYSKQFRFKEAETMFKSYEKHLRKIDVNDTAALENYRKETARLRRMVSHTEDIQIIDSLVVDKSNFLSAYKVSLSTGRLDLFNNVFSGEKLIKSTVYFNELGSKIYYSRPQKDTLNYTLYSKERLIDGYSNEKKLSENNFGLVGDVNYPFLQADGLTIYFAANDENSIGGYDLFVSRYNMNNDTFLNPERLNMPFNSLFNDYMLVIDEEKGIGWFASDRFQPEGKVCVYTFIPNELVKIVESDNEAYLANRAFARSIKQTWNTEQDYTSLLALARKEVKATEKVKKDFEFVINDKQIYYTLKDFKSEQARELYERVLQLKIQHNALSEKLEGDRKLYPRASLEAKESLSNHILSDEKRILTLEEDIKMSEKKTRNTEISYLDTSK